MKAWLAAIAVPVIVAAAFAHAQARKQLAEPVAEPATHARDFDLRLPSDRQPSRFSHGTIAEQDVAPNMSFNIGFADMLMRKKRALRIDEGPTPSRRPAVSFRLKF